MEINNKYTSMQKQFYEKNADTMAEVNHMHHNKNEDYWNILLGDIKSDPSRWKGLNALDFGCGCGRNVFSLHSLADWATADGCDISKGNVDHARTYLSENGIDVGKSRLFETDGISLSGIPSNEYDFIMSTIVLQHICVNEIRFSILEDIYRVTKPSGMFSFQMGYGHAHPKTVDYYANCYEAKETNSRCDVRVDSPEQIINDLTKIGFKDVKYEIKESYSDRHKQWIYIKAIK